jgi:hypothetical protein
MYTEHEFNDKITANKNESESYHFIDLYHQMLRFTNRQRIDRYILKSLNMKKVISNAVLLFVILVAGLVSCEKNKTKDPDSTDKVKKILEMEARMQALNSGTGKVTEFMTVIGHSQFKEGSLDIPSNGTEPGSTDSVIIDTAGYWIPITCATVTETDNEDGTHTTVYDYGSGCEEYGSFVRGKITYIWRNDENSYYSEVIYDHYYSYGVEMNGLSRYTFTSDGNSYYTTGCTDAAGDSTYTLMPVEFNWSGTSTGFEEIDMKFDDGNSVYYSSDYSNIWDSISYKVIRGDYYYSSSSEGFEYEYRVTVPMITDYRCTDTWIPVTGTEIISYTEQGVTYEYSLNYGNGDCDNLAELTQDGKTSIVDFGELSVGIDGGGVTVEPSTGR